MLTSCKYCASQQFSDRLMCDGRIPKALGQLRVSLVRSIDIGVGQRIVDIGNSQLFGQLIFIRWFQPPQLWN